MVIITKMDTATQVRILSEAFYISDSANTHRKVIKPTIFPPLESKYVVG